LAESIKRLLPALAAVVALTAAPQAAALPAAGTTPAGEVVVYDTAAPGTILDRQAITGLLPGETVQGLDVRPATGQLYALGILGMEGRIYVIDPGTGAATLLGPGPFSAALTPAAFGFDFNPDSDRIRIVSSTDQNLRVNPNNGFLVQLDDPLNDASGNEQVSAVAYDQNNHDTTQTTLWGYDFDGNQVVRIGGFNGLLPEGSPNSGVVTVVRATSIIAGVAVPLGMDIAPTGEAFLTVTTAGPTTHSLHRINLGGGADTQIGMFPEQVDDVAVLQPSSIALDGPVSVVDEAAGSATISVRRTGNTTGTQAVAYATSDASATSDDYTPSFGTLAFGPGETSKTFAVPVEGDAADEPWETVNLTLSGATGGAALGTPASGTLTIVDDDQPAAPADTVQPQLLVSVPATRRRAQINRGLRGKIAASEACAVQLTLKLKKRTIGTGTLAPAGPGVTDFTVRPGKRGRKALRKRLRSRRTAVVRVRARGTDAVGNAGTATARLTIRR
jgi:hypothetical protein